MNTSFFDLPWEQRKAIVNKRLSGDKWLVWDYAPNKDGAYGVIEKLPKSIDRGFVHGYVMSDSSVCPLIRGYYTPFEINVHTDQWYEDETFENRHIHPYHIFTSYEKAKEYAEKVAKNNKQTITLETLLPTVKKHFKDARIAVGRRGYENLSTPYECIVADGGWTTITIKNNKLIMLQFGQSQLLVIPHVELFNSCFDYIPEYQHIDVYRCYEWDEWNDYYYKGCGTFS